MSLIRAPLDLLYGSTPAEFESDFGLDESIARLKAATGRTVFSALTQQRAVGPVSESRVCLQRCIPMFRNSFKPLFIGSFTVKNERAVLAGRFTMPLFTKVFLSLWFGFLFVWTVGALILPWNVEPTTWVAPIFGIAMFCMGVGIAGLGKWLSRNDAEWLSEVMRRALSDEAHVRDRIRVG